MNKNIIELLDTTLELLKKKNCNIDVEDFLKYHKLDVLYNSVKGKELTVRQKRILKRRDKYLNEFNLICKEVKKRGIDISFLKGFGLSSIYGEGYYWRYSSDIDILVNMSQIEEMESLLKEMGYKYGFVVDGKIVEPTRKKILFKKLYTHELYPMVKIENGYPLYVDVNFLFSWKGIEKKFFVDIKPSDWIKNVDKKTLTLNKHLNLIHMCVHFYNEAVFFLLDDEYGGGDPKEFRLFRLFDIMLFIDDFSNDDIVVVKKMCEKYFCIEQIIFVLKCIDVIYGEKYVGKYKDYFKYENVDVDYYYTKTGEKNKWAYDLVSRIFDNDIRKNMIQEIRRKNEVCREE